MKSKEKKGKCGRRQLKRKGKKEKRKRKRGFKKCRKKGKGRDRNRNRKKCKLEESESDSDMSSFIIYDDNSWDDCWPPNVDGSGDERDDGNACYVCKRTDGCWPPNVDGSGDERDDGNACYVCKRTDDLEGWVGCDECVRWFHRTCCGAKKKPSFKNGS
ncbi:hypothetical protein PoB_004372200 [Plakobranchus ocellatus]|uniref:PHD-type domain-containing protein n=1 Tax=Plakobranchus ocellatus TaxID=259542 RepID=A0AAV4BDF4_9GAST|nr:hypothetical protein PoB_004372200 [Plakobranchus ocellatus]